MNLILRLVAGLLGGGLLLTAGCRTAPANTATVQSIDDRLAARAPLLRVGMHKPQVIEWLGEPRQTEPATNANGQRETWIYEFEHPPRYRTIAAETVEVPYVDPFTGVMRMLQEPVFKQERIRHLETLALSFRGPRLIDIDRQPRILRDYDR